MSSPGRQSQAQHADAAEIADGWILLFDGETTFGWSEEGKSGRVSCDNLSGGLRTKAMHSIGRAVANSFDLQFEQKSEGNGEFELAMVRVVSTLQVTRLGETVGKDEWLYVLDTDPDEFANAAGV